jgi:hypothetical protein
MLSGGLKLDIPGTIVEEPGSPDSNQLSAQSMASERISRRPLRPASYKGHEHLKSAGAPGSQHDQSPSCTVHVAAVASTSSPSWSHALLEACHGSRTASVSSTPQPTSAANLTSRGESGLGVIDNEVYSPERSGADSLGPVAASEDLGKLMRRSGDKEVPHERFISAKAAMTIGAILDIAQTTMAAFVKRRLPARLQGCMHGAAFFKSRAGTGDICLPEEHHSLATFSSTCSQDPVCIHPSGHRLQVEGTMTIFAGCQTSEVLLNVCDSSPWTACY